MDGKGSKRGKFVNIVHDILLKFDDPIIECKLNGNSFLTYYSSNRPMYMMQYPTYNQMLKRICAYLKLQYKRNINIIDVGANIGDTVLDIGDKENRYLLVEGTDKFFSLIPNNLNGYDYKLICSFCGESDGTIKSHISFAEPSSAQLKIESNASSRNMYTLDTIVMNENFIADFIKIDTDGFDFQVLRGANSTLRRYKPMLFFEWELPYLLLNKEDPIGIFSYLEECGYEKLILFDNFGNMFAMIDCSNEEMLRYLIEYTKYKTIYYFDVLAVHKDSIVDLRELWNYLKQKE